MQGHSGSWISWVQEKISEKCNTWGAE